MFKMSVIFNILLEDSMSISLKRIFVLFVIINTIAFSQAGKLRVGFDIDDTVLFSEPTFIAAPEVDNRLDFYAWINTHDKDYSLLIDPVITLINYFHAHGHDVFFITARPGIMGDSVAVFLSNIVNFDVKVDSNLFFSPKEDVGDFRYTTKHRVMKKLDIDIFYGDSDTDIIAAIKADVHPVRILRCDESIESYGGNYFGDTNIGNSAEAPFNKDDLDLFYKANVGLYGESIYPITWNPKELQ